MFLDKNAVHDLNNNFLKSCMMFDYPIMLFSSLTIPKRSSSALSCLLEKKNSPLKRLVSG